LNGRDENNERNQLHFYLLSETAMNKSLDFRFEQHGVARQLSFTVLSSE
jgi:hypothetical protein